MLANDDTVIIYLHTWRPLQYIPVCRHKRKSLLCWHTTHNHHTPLFCIRRYLWRNTALVFVVMPFKPCTCVRLLIQGVRPKQVHIHCEKCDVKRETVHCYPRNVDRCDQRWPDVVAGISARFSKFAFVLFCYITNHLMTGPLGNSEFCFPSISMKHWDSRETKFTVS